MIKSLSIGLMLALCVAGGIFFFYNQDNSTQYTVDAEIVSINAKDGIIFARHEEIKNYMEAMTMPFVVKNKSELNGLEGGDAIRFILHVDETAGDSWITQLQRIPNKELQLPLLEKTPKASQSNIPVLMIDDEVPNASFLNQDGEKIQFSDYKGQNLFVSFIFTRCPLPNLCPRVSKQMKQVQELSTPSDNLKFLSLSFDPLYDTPEVLKAYAKKYGATPPNWQFATAPLEEMQKVSSQFGVTAIKSPELLIEHTLVAALISKEGKLLRRWTTNDWKPEKVLEELRLNL